MDLLNLVFGTAFLIARFLFGVLMLGVGVISIVSAVMDDRLPYKKHTSDVLGIVLMFVVDTFVSYSGYWLFSVVCH